MAEWSIAHAWKACLPQGNGGSNPPPSATLILRGLRRERRKVTTEVTTSPANSAFSAPATLAAPCAARSPAEISPLPGFRFRGAYPFTLQRKEEGQSARGTRREDRASAGRAVAAARWQSWRRSPLGEQPDAGQPSRPARAWNNGAAPGARAGSVERDGKGSQTFWECCARTGHGTLTPKGAGAVTKRFLMGWG